jgi:predicted oxidoreductase
MTKVALSPIIAGTMNWGVWDKKLTSSEMQNTIEVCLESGISSFDHADIYGSYTTENEFGKAFNNCKIERNQVQFISKCGIKSVSENRNYALKHYDYSKAHIIWSVENSLKNLQTDYLDVLLLHRPSPLMQVDEIAEAIYQLKSEDKILDFGVSNFTPSQTALLNQKIPVDFNQIQFSATHFEPMLDGSLDFMQQHDIRPMAWNPLGSFFKSYDEKSIRIKNVVSVLASKYEVETDIILLSWILKHPAKVIPVVGTTSISRIKDLNKATAIHLETEEWFGIWTASLGKHIP